MRYHREISGGFSRSTALYRVRDFEKALAPLLECGPVEESSTSRPHETLSATPPGSCRRGLGRSSGWRRALGHGHQGWLDGLLPPSPRWGRSLIERSSVGNVPKVLADLVIARIQRKVADVAIRSGGTQEVPGFRVWHGITAKQESHPQPSRGSLRGPRIMGGKARPPIASHGKVRIVSNHNRLNGTKLVNP